MPVRIGTTCAGQNNKRVAGSDPRYSMGGNGICGLPLWNDLIAWLDTAVWID